LNSNINISINAILTSIKNKDKDINIKTQNFIDIAILNAKEWVDDGSIDSNLLLAKEFPLTYNKQQLENIHQILLFIENKDKNNVKVKLVHLFFSGLIQNFEKGLKYFLIDTINKSDDNSNIKQVEIILQIISISYKENIKINLSDREYTIIVSYFLLIINSNEFLKWDISSQFMFLGLINRLFLLERPYIFKTLCQSLGKVFNIYLQNIKNNPFAFMDLYDGFRMLFWKSREKPYEYVIYFDEIITKPYVKYLEKYQEKYKHLKRAKKEKIKNVCYMLTNTYCTTGYAPAYLLKTIHKAHYDYGSSDIKFYLYSIGGFDRDVNNEYKTSLEEANITIREFPPLRSHKNYLEILKYANKDNIDVAILNMNFSTQTFLFSAQIAPYQIYLNHGFSAFTPSNIDHNIWFDNEVVPQCLKEYVHNNDYLITKIDYWKYYDINTGIINDDLKNKKEEELLKYPKNKTILGNMQSLERINESFLDIVVEVLQNSENTIFICCGGGDMSLLNKYINKYQLQNRLFAPGFVNPHLYGHIINIVMNTPFSSALSVLDFLVKGKIVISFAKTSITIEPISIDKIGLIVHSPQEYIDIVLKLTNDIEFYKKIKNKISNNFKNYINSKSGVQDFENLMDNLSKKYQ
jgi:hypothetical protein